MVAEVPPVPAPTTIQAGTGWRSWRICWKIASLLHEPDVLILDEPTTGLDPNQIADVRDAIRELGRTKTILLSTHILQEVHAMADRVLFITEGRLVFDGPVADFADSGESLDRSFRRLSQVEG